ncbi:MULTISPECIES: FMN-binding protein MioC [Ferrimonas]|uniref:FMN-binding protein MioC n=1 Tax=Ferrimonas TaxID=44011 RepID=UPI000423B864|nr:MULTISPECIES: FMN-binding protein MioC [Ferrimonas]USD37620.1 FMN-binding protein MioC [Ferrimonas sp. SCSIO 43195]
MTPLAVIVGTTMGGAEAVADELADKLAQHQIQCQQFLDPTLEQLTPFPHWLIVTSTHGAGDLPDNLLPFANSLESAQLSGTQFAICGIGDSSYDTFCGAARTLDRLLQQAGAQPLVNKIEIDVQAVDLPEDRALEWIDELISIFN